MKPQSRTTICPFFTEKYYQKADAEQRLLGYGGASSSVERRVVAAQVPVLDLAFKPSVALRASRCRCFAKASGQKFAAKRLSSELSLDFWHLAVNKTQSLVRARCNNM